MENPSPSNVETRDFGSSAAAVIEDAYRRLHEFQIQDVVPNKDGVAKIAVVPEGKKIQDLKPILDAYLAKPERRRGTARFFDLASFIEFVARNESADSAVFAKPDLAKPSFVAVIDYHPAGSDATDADWLQHRGVYEPDLSEEWKVWTANDGEPMTQEQFAAFIEDNITDLVVPDREDEKNKAFAELVAGRWAFPSDVHELSRNLSVNVATTVRNAVTLASGEITVLYDEQHKDGEGAPIKVANLFQIAIPVFYGGEAWRMAVRLRYRIAGGRLNWFYQIVRPDRVFDDAFKGIVKQIDDAVAGTVFLGTPEA